MLLFLPLLAFVAGTATTVLAKKKSVTAHLMFGEMQDYKVEDHVADQLLARESGIDAFAINSGHDTYDIQHMDNIFEASKQTGFPLFFSFDMLHYNQKNASNWILHDYLIPYASRDEYYKIDGKIVVSTFSGAQKGSYINDVSSFKEANDIWQTIIDTAKTFSPPLDIYFVPFWLARSAVDDPDSSDLSLGGVGNWFGFGGVGDKGNVSAEPDGRWHDSCSKRGIDYWAPVSAQFSVHQVETNNYVMAGGNWLLATHYQELIELGDRAPDHIELISWSDWGESTYFSPVRARANQPHETVDTAVYANREHDHVPLLRLATYYNHWFKNGVAPKITNDVIFWWYRGQETQAAPPNDPLEQPAGWEALTDTIWAVVLLPDDTKAFEAVISSGGKDVKTQTVSPGVNLVRGEFKVGKQSISLRDKDSKVIISGSGVDITNTPEWWDYNYYSYIIPSDFKPSDFLEVDRTDTLTVGSAKPSDSTESRTTAKSSSTSSETTAASEASSPNAVSSRWWVITVSSLVILSCIMMVVILGKRRKTKKLKTCRRSSSSQCDSDSSLEETALSSASRMSGSTDSSTTSDADSVSLHSRRSLSFPRAQRPLPRNSIP